MDQLPVIKQYMRWEHWNNRCIHRDKKDNIERQQVRARSKLFKFLMLKL